MLLDNKTGSNKESNINVRRKNTIKRYKLETKLKPKRIRFTNSTTINFWKISKPYTISTKTKQQSVIESVSSTVANLRGNRLNNFSKESLEIRRKEFIA